MKIECSPPTGMCSVRVPVVGGACKLQASNMISLSKQGPRPMLHWWSLADWCCFFAASKSLVHCTCSVSKMLGIQTLWSLCTMPVSLPSPTALWAQGSGVGKAHHLIVGSDWLLPHEYSYLHLTMQPLFLASYRRFPRSWEKWSLPDNSFWSFWFCICLWFSLLKLLRSFENH